MIRYRCPRCKKSLTAEESEAGTKKNCPYCEQRVLIPVPPHPTNKTMLGTLEQPNKTVLGTLEDAAPAAIPPMAEYAGAAPAVPRTIVVETAATEAGPTAEPPHTLEEVEDDRPRPRRRKRADDEDDGDYPIARRRRASYRPCPRCGCTDYPRQQTRFGGASIALLIVGIIFWPLLIVAFFVQEKWDVCPDCGEKLRQTGTGF